MRIPANLLMWCGLPRNLCCWGFTLRAVGPLGVTHNLTPHQGHHSGVAGLLIRIDLSQSSHSYSYVGNVMPATPGT
jgi:hypothetical protein